MKVQTRILLFKFPSFVLNYFRSKGSRYNFKVRKSGKFMHCTSDELWISNVLYGEQKDKKGVGLL